MEVKRVVVYGQKNECVDVETEDGKGYGFTIKSISDEISRDRDYLVHNFSNLRVRLRGRDQSNIKDAFCNFVKGYENKTLYKHPE